MADAFGSDLTYNRYTRGLASQPAIYAEELAEPDPSTGAQTSGR